MTKTDALVKINSLKERHESLKKEILDLVTEIEEKETELTKIEFEYVKCIEILTKED